MRRAFYVLLLGSAAFSFALIGGARAEEPVRSTTADVILSPDEFHGRAVALGGCQLGQLPEGPACWVLVNGRGVGVIPLQDVSKELADRALDTCPRPGIGNGQACLVRVFGRVEKDSTVSLALRSAAIKFPD